MRKITIARGDGIGPEIMDATLRVLKAAGAQLGFEEIELGEKVYRKGITAGIEQEAWDSLRSTRVLLKAPVTTPQGGGFKSINVTMRKVLGLYANVRPCVSYHPFVKTKHPVMDVVIIRENEEDLYAGIEHRQTDDVYQCLKLVSRPGTEKIIRYAFEFAKAYGRKKISCFTKDNIMKMTDGLFHKIFEEVGSEYPGIEKEHWIVDIGAAKLADTPEQFDVIVMPNLYGDILSDIAAQITGSVGLAGSANIGEGFAMFEAIHGSAPDIAGTDTANPSGLLSGAIQMLVHVGQQEIAEKIQNAWLRTLEDGIHTADIYKPGVSKIKTGTKGFADAVIERLGSKPSVLTPVVYGKNFGEFRVFVTPKAAAHKELKGIDVFVQASNKNADEIAALIQQATFQETIQLQMITNRGTKVWPNGFPETYCTDHWRCRFKHTDGESNINYEQAIELQHQLFSADLDIIKTENLYWFDGKPGFTAAQGQ